VVRQRVAHEAGDECLFHFHPIFVADDLQVDEKAASPGVHLQAKDEQLSTAPPPPAPFFQTARQALESEATLWDWDDDVEFLGLSQVEFCKS
jgi:hypothetical protein